MKNEHDGLGDYVRQVGEATQRYAKSLLAENEKLLGLATTLHHEKVRLETELESVRGVHTSLMEQIAQMDASNRAFAEQYVDVEQQSSNLANLYVASYRIHGSLEREDVLTTMREIIINIIGSEEFVVLQRRGNDGALEVATSFGLDAARYAGTSARAGRIGDAMSSGETYVASAEDVERDAGDERMRACVPLKVAGSVIGAVVIVSLLPHKPNLEAIDHELFDLLATHAATALYCSDLHAELRQARGAAA